MTEALTSPNLDYLMPTPERVVSTLQSNKKKLAWLASAGFGGKPVRLKTVAEANPSLRSELDEIFEGSILGVMTRGIRPNSLDEPIVQTETHEDGSIVLTAEGRLYDGAESDSPLPVLLVITKTPVDSMHPPVITSMSVTPLESPPTQ